MVEPHPEARPAFSETIHFSRNWTVELEFKWRPLNARLGLYMLGTIAWTAAVGIPNPLTRAFGQVYVALVLGFPIVVCPILFEVWNFRRWRARRRAVALAKIADEPDQSYRVRCVGLPDDFAALGELHDVSFEPQLFYGGLGVPLDPYVALRWAIVSAVVLVLIAILRSGTILGGFFMAAFVSTLPAGIVGWILTVLIWPGYVRIVPGRLDILEYGPFRTEPRCVRAYNLKQRTVTVDTNRRIAVLGRRVKDELAFGLMPDGRRLAYYILLAAISTHEAGPLPRNELIG